MYKRNFVVMEDQIRRLREERDELIAVDRQRDRKYHEDGETIDDLKMQIHSIQQERDKLLRVIQHIVAGTEDAITEDYCRSILREFGVGEERT